MAARDCLNESYDSPHSTIFTCAATAKVAKCLCLLPIELSSIWTVRLQLSRAQMTQTVRLRRTLNLACLGSAGARDADEIQEGFSKLRSNSSKNIPGRFAACRPRIVHIFNMLATCFHRSQII